LTQTGWFSFCSLRKTTPSSLEAARWRACAPRRSADASRYFFDRSATPPCGDARRGVAPTVALRHFFHSSIDRPTETITYLPAELSAMTRTFNCTLDAQPRQQFSFTPFDSPARPSRNQTRIATKGLARQS